jgi:hypothetical protein
VAEIVRRRRESEPNTIKATVVDSSCSLVEIMTKSDGALAHPPTDVPVITLTLPEYLHGFFSNILRDDVSV